MHKLDEFTSINMYSDLNIFKIWRKKNDRGEDKNIYLHKNTIQKTKSKSDTVTFHGMKIIKYLFFFVNSVFFCISERKLNKKKKHNIYLL